MGPATPVHAALREGVPAPLARPRKLPRGAEYGDQSVGEHRNTVPGAHPREGKERGTEIMRFELLVWVGGWVDVESSALSRSLPTKCGDTVVLSTPTSPTPIFSSLRATKGVEKKLNENSHQTEWSLASRRATRTIIISAVRCTHKNRDTYVI